MRFSGKTAIVTGAGSGIGKEIALSLAAEGCEVIGLDINEKAMAVMQDTMKSQGWSGRFYTVDLTKQDEVENVIRNVVDECGKIDILVHSAGVTFKVGIQDLTLDMWNKTIEINLTGTYIIAKAVVPVMIKQKYGKIVIISSGSAITGTGGGAHYAASKAGQIGFTRALANELAQYNINVNAIGPRNIETPLLQNLYTSGNEAKLLEKIPLKRLGVPKDVANLTLFLVSDESSYITGQFLLVDGGRTFSC